MILSTTFIWQVCILCLVLFSCTLLPLFLCTTISVLSVLMARSHHFMRNHVTCLTSVQMLKTPYSDECFYEVFEATNNLVSFILNVISMYQRKTIQFLYLLMDISILFKLNFEGEQILPWKKTK